MQVPTKQSLTRTNMDENGSMAAVRRAAYSMYPTSAKTVANALRVMRYGPHLFNACIQDTRLKQLKLNEGMLFQIPEQSKRTVEGLELFAAQWMTQAHNDAMALLDQKPQGAVDFFRELEFFTEFNACGEPSFWWRTRHNGMKIHWGLDHNGHEHFMVSMQGADGHIAVNHFSNRNNHFFDMSGPHVWGWTTYMRFLGVLINRKDDFGIPSLQGYKDVYDTKNDQKEE